MPLGQPNVQDDSSRMSFKKGGVFTPPFSMENYDRNRKIRENKIRYHQPQQKTAIFKSGTTSE